MKKILALIISFSLLAHTFGQRATPALKITHLTGDFYVFTTYHDYKGTAFPSNSMYLVTNKGVVMFDTPWDTAQFQPLLDSIQARHHKKVTICIATHFHEDRTAGLAYYRQQGISTYTTRMTDSLAAAHNAKRAARLIDKDTVFTVGQYNFETWYPGQGHSPDNIIIWFGQQKIIYGGCLIKSVEARDPGNLSDANVKEWPATIHRIQKKYKHPNFIITGHQDWLSKNALEHTLQLLQEQDNKKGW